MCVCAQKFNNLGSDVPGYLRGEVEDGGLVLSYLFITLIFFYYIIQLYRYTWKLCVETFLWIYIFIEETAVNTLGNFSSTATPAGCS